MTGDQKGGRPGRPPKPRRPVPPHMAEEALMQAVLDLCKFRHVRAVHFPPSYTARGRVITAYRGDGKGWPDLHLVGPGGVLYRELKDDQGRPTQEQQQYLDDLTAAGCDSAVWRPVDLQSGRIAREIDGIARPPATITHLKGPRHADHP